MSDADGTDNLTATIGRYNDAWNAQDLDAITQIDRYDLTVVAAGKGRRRRSSFTAL